MGINSLSSLLKKVFTKEPNNFKKSFSQCGEDVIVDFLFAGIGISKPNYLDIGANDPVKFSNTYFFYKNRKSNGVLIEPNPILYSKLKRKRPEDIIINCGVGFEANETIADYYEMNWHEFNTFSKEVAYETQTHYQGRNDIKKVSRMKLISINNILETYFMSGLDFLSMDVEGLDIEILKSWNFDLCKPKIICVETKASNIEKSSDISDFLLTKGYKLFASTPINGIFVNSEFIK